MTAQTPFRLWLPQKVRPLVRAVGLIGLLFGVITLSVAARESVTRWDRATQTWARSAEILISKREIPTLNAVTEFLRHEYPSVQIGIQDGKRVLWSYPEGGFDSSSRGSAFTRSLPLNADSGLVAEIRVNWLDVVQVVIWTCLIALGLAALSFSAFATVFRFCIDRIVGEVDRLKHGAKSEVQELSELVTARENAEKERASAEGQAALGRMATQVAHDIRSPLAALNALEVDLHSLPENTRDLLSAAVARIREITRDLKATGRAHIQGKEIDQEAVSIQDLTALIDPLIAEKKLELRGLANTRLFWQMDPDQGPMSVELQPSEFRRLLSNLINNAAESLPQAGGSILVTARLDSGQVHINIQDNGKGIPPEVLPHLGLRGETHGKSGGSGLGLFHAKEAAKRWGGHLSIESNVGVGTSVTLSLPTAVP